MKPIFIQAAAVAGPDGFGRLGSPRPPMTGAGLPKWDEWFQVPYERYPRLDPLSKITACAAELVLEHAPENHPGMILCTHSGCREADREYYRTAGGNTPELASPKIFPYTLPSAALAEISIRFKLTGPSLVLWGRMDVSPAFSQVVDWLRRGEVESGLVLAADAVFGEAPRLEAWAFRLGLRPGPWRMEKTGESREELSPQTLAEALETRDNMEHAGWRVFHEEDADRGLNPGVEAKDHRHV